MFRRPPPTITIVSVDPDNCFNDGCIHATFTGCCLLFSYSYFDPCNLLLSYSIAQTPDSNIFCNLGGNLYHLCSGCLWQFHAAECDRPLSQRSVDGHPEFFAVRRFGLCGSGGRMLLVNLRLGAMALLRISALPWRSVVLCAK